MPQTYEGIPSMFLTCLLSTLDSNLRSNYFKEGEPNKDMVGIHEDIEKEKEAKGSKALKDPMTRGRLRRLQEEVLQNLGGLRTKPNHILCVLELYYDWELKVEQNLDCINCEDLTKVKVIALSYKDYVLIWWSKIALQIKGLRRVSIESMEELKRETRERFVPLYYKKDFFMKLKKIYQGSKSIEKYFIEMEVTIIRAQIVESQETTMIKFLHGLNSDIQDVMELHGYTSISTLIH
ncbi:hypothetical protein CR513_21687, partial [Mucuna pruriens]